jgi:hypothetical protein
LLEQEQPAFVSCLGFLATSAIIDFLCQKLENMTIFLLAIAPPKR